MTILSDCLRTARRPGTAAVWQCFWCWAHIKKGEQYREQRYVEDGTINTVRFHPECGEAHERSGLDPEEPINEPQPRGMTASERFWGGVARAKAEVATWPEWKRNAFVPGGK
jgi:hypothetical protein